jgi:hypothetical protein
VGGGEYGSREQGIAVLFFGREENTKKECF